MTENELKEALKGVKEVDAPPFLYSRIEARLNTAQFDHFSNKQVLAFSMALFLVFWINAMTIFQTSSHRAVDETASVAGKNYGLVNDNQLYHE